MPSERNTDGRRIKITRVIGGQYHPAGILWDIAGIVNFQPEKEFKYNKKNGLCRPVKGKDGLIVLIRGHE